MPEHITAFDVGISISFPLPTTSQVDHTLPRAWPGLTCSILIPCLASRKSISSVAEGLEGSSVSIFRPLPCGVWMSLSHPVKPVEFIALHSPGDTHWFSVFSLLPSSLFFKNFIDLFGCAVWHVGSEFPNHGPNLRPLRWKRSPNCWTSREVPSFLLSCGF